MHNASVLGREPVTVYKKPIVLSPSEAQTTVCIEEAQSVDQLVFYSPAFEQKLHHFGPAPYLCATRRAAHMICSQIMPLTRASFLRGKKIFGPVLLRQGSADLSNREQLPLGHHVYNLKHFFARGTTSLN